MESLDMRKSAMAGALVSVAARGFGTLVSVSSIAVVSRLFNKLDFSAWVAFLSVFALIGAQDFGVAASLRVRISKSIFNGDLEHARLEFTSAFWGVSLLVAVVAVALLILHPDPRILGIPATYSVQVCLVIASGLAMIPGLIVWNSMYAFLESATVAWFDIARSLMQLVVVILMWVSKPAFTVGVLAFYSAWVICVFGGYLAFSRKRGWVTFPTGLDVTSIKRMYLSLIGVYKSGISLWVVQVLVLVLTTSDVLLATRIIGLDRSAGLSIVWLIANTSATFVAVAVAALLGNYANEIARGNVEWLRKVVRLKVGLTGAIFLVMLIVLLGMGSVLVHAWTGRNVVSPGLLVLGALVFACTSLVTIFMGPFVGAGDVKWLIAPLLLGVGVKVGLSSALGLQYGAQGILVASVLASGFVGLRSLLELKRRGFI